MLMQEVLVLSPGSVVMAGIFIRVCQYGHENVGTYEGWNFNNGNYLFTTDTK